MKKFFAFLFVLLFAAVTYCMACNLAGGGQLSYSPGTWALWDCGGGSYVMIITRHDCVTIQEFSI